MENEDTQQSSASHGVLIDNATGDVTEPHPLTLMSTGGSDDQDGTNTGNQDEETVNDDGAGDGSDGSSGTASDSGDSQDSGDAAAPPVTQPNSQAQTPQAQTPRLEDPGEFAPNKDGRYSFDVTLADGTSFRIEKPEDIDKLPPTPEFASVQDHARFNAAYSKMITGLEADKRDWDKAKSDFDVQESSEQEITDYIAGIENGMLYLEKSGKLPALPPEYNDVAKWNDPEVAKQPGVKERLALVNFIAKENAARVPLGLPKVTALEAFAELRNQAYETQATQRTQKQNELRKQRGAMVTGASRPAPSARSTDGMIVGSGGSLSEL